jgi:HEAT repeats/Vacuolar 14 Fab1-binding region
MSRNVDEIWKALKSSATPSAPRGTASAQRDRFNCTRSTSDQNRPPSNAVDNSVSRKATEDETADPPSEVLSQRDINSLSDADRTVRKQAILKLHKHVCSLQGSKHPGQLHDVFGRESIQRKLVAMLCDTSDVCREKALNVVCIYLAIENIDTVFVAQILEALRVRMGVGQASPLEPVEEIRQRIANVTASAIVPRCVEYGMADATAGLLIRCLEDPFHETKKAACQGIGGLAHQCTSQQLSEFCPKLLVPLMGALRHPHSRVREAAMKALSAVVLHSAVSDEAVSTQIVPALQSVANDRSPDLRASCFRACADWLSEWAAKGPGSSGETIHHVLPVLLLGLTDGNGEIAAECLRHVEQVGEVYCFSGDSAVDEEMRDQRASSSDPDQAKSAAANLPAPLSGRASNVARTMMQRELKYVLPPVLKDAQEWTAALRCSASRSLYSIMALAESAVTPHLDRILQALCLAVGDEDQDVTVRIIHCVHVIGAFCEVCACII